MNSIGIVGAGTMGAGIAQAAAAAGAIVFLTDVSAAALEKGLAHIGQELERLAQKGRIPQDLAPAVLARIHRTEHLEDVAAADLIIEAAVEVLEVKQDILKRLSQTVREETILSSNTSSLSITALASVAKNPASVVGMHFFNPAPVMKLVEVVRGSQTSESTVQRAVRAALDMGKAPVVCSDTPGFIVNRIARPFYGEALRLLGEGVASVGEIDTIMKEEGGFRMGPFELMDLIGIDVNYAVTRSVYEQFFQEPRFRPHPIQRRMVEAGTLGRKTGKGFYDYPGTGKS